MRKIFGLFLFVNLIACLLIGCTSSYQQNQMHSAYALLNENPDSALSKLHEIDYHNLPEKELAYYCLVHTIAQDKSGWDVTSDSLLRYAKIYYDDRVKDTLYAKYCYYMGKYHELLEEEKLAEDYLHKAIRKAEDDHDYYTQYLAWNRLSKSLNSSTPEQSVLAAKQAYRIYTEHCSPNLVNKGYLIISIGDSYSLTEQLDSCFYYYQKALSFADSIHSQELISASHQSLWLAYTKIHQYKEAFLQIKRAWEMASVRDEHLKYALARAYINVDSLDQCTALMNELCNSKLTSMRYLAYEYKARAALRLAGKPVIEQLVDSAFHYFNKRHNSMLEDRTVYYQEKLQLQEDNEQILAKSEMKERMWMLLTFAAILAAVIAAFYWRNNQLQRDHKVELLAMELKASEDKAKLIQQNSEHKIAMMRKYIISKLQFMEKLNESNQNPNSQIDIDEDTWLEMEGFLNSFEDEFVKRLHEAFPDLSVSDLRFCMLLRLNFSIKEIGKVYHIADVSVKQKQNKFKNKLGLDGSIISLRKFIQTF